VPAVIVGLLVSCAAVAGYLLGSWRTRENIAKVFDRRFRCTCGARVDRPVALARCDCGEEYVGPAIGDEIRDEYFFESDVA
jgi:hypothetical protein